MDKRTKAKLETRIKETVAQLIIRDLADPRLGFVTVTGVDLSQEMDVARVYVSVLGPEGDRRKTLVALKDASGFLQEGLTRVLTTRRIPRLSFVHDDSIATADRVDHLIRQARAEDDAAASARGDDEAPDADAQRPG